EALARKCNFIFLPGCRNWHQRCPACILHRSATMPEPSWPSMVQDERPIKTKAAGAATARQCPVLGCAGDISVRCLWQQRSRRWLQAVRADWEDILDLKESIHVRQEDWCRGAARRLLVSGARPR